MSCMTDCFHTPEQHLINIHTAHFQSNTWIVGRGVEIVRQLPEFWLVFITFFLLPIYCIYNSVLIYWIYWICMTDCFHTPEQHLINIHTAHFQSNTQGCGNSEAIARILACFHHLFPAPHILYIQLSFNLLDIH